MVAPRYLNPLLGKVLAIGALSVLLLIPLGQLRGLTTERSSMRELATERVADGWGGAQIVGSPILSVPLEIQREERGRSVRRMVMHRLLAATGDIRGALKTSERHVGIYTVPVYQTRLQVAAAFAPAEGVALLAEEARSTARWSEATLFVPVSDLRGIREIIAANWGDQPLHLQPAEYDGLTGVSARVDATGLRDGQTRKFLLELELAGSRSLRTLPLARVTTVRLRSSWRHPGFEGAYLPASYTLTDNGFDAHWRVLELNRGFPQSWIDYDFGCEKLEAAAFGVNLFQPVDTYHRNERALKYAVLFIALTFMSVFLWEQLTGVRIHAMQYLLVGLALCVFYLLLLALSEHVGFIWAYVAAAAAQVVLISTYLGSGLNDRRIGGVVGSALAAVYGLLYLLILSEQYALLLGALLVFAVLAALMWVTRRTDWYRLSDRARPTLAADET